MSAEKKTKRRVTYVKLGEKAATFFDPSSRLNLRTKDEIKVLDKQHRTKRTLEALRNGHLEKATEDDYNDYQLLQSEKGTAPKKESVGDGNPTSDDWKENVEYTEAGLKKLTKPKLIELATDLETEYSEEEMDKLTKAEVAEEILELKEEDEDEDGDNEDE